MLMVYTVMANPYTDPSNYDTDSQVSFNISDAQYPYDTRRYSYGTSSSVDGYSAGPYMDRYMDDEHEYGTEFGESFSVSEHSDDFYPDEDELSSEICLYERKSYDTDASSSEFLSVMDDFTDDGFSWSASSENFSSFPASGSNTVSQSFESVAGKGFKNDLAHTNGKRYVPTSILKQTEDIRKSGTGKTSTKETGLTRNCTANNEHTVITTETIEKVREAELEDILQYAKDITEPDPSANMTFCTQPAKLVEGSFQHVLAVREVYSKTGAFKFRSIEVARTCDEELGFSVRRGDGWEKNEGIHISRISLGSVFDRYALLSVGDELIKVNKIDVRKMGIDDVIRLMYIPERLTVTVKMLTPFSKKRVEKSPISQPGKSKKFFPGPGSRSVDYKIANLKIGSSRRNLTVPKEVEHKQTEQPVKQSSKKTSPYRTTSEGNAPPNRLLSPIREVASETQLHRSNSLNNSRRRHSTVTWSDQRGPRSARI